MKRTRKTLRDRSARERKQLSKRLRKYGIGAVSIAATTFAAGTSHGELVTLPVSISSSNSLEAFIDILPFATGASAIDVEVAYNTVSFANPLAPNSELMLRGITGLAQLRPNNGAELAVFPSPLFSSYYYVKNVNQCFAFPAFNAGTFMYNASAGYNASLTYPGFGAGEFPVGSTGVAYFTFTNTGTGLEHDGWAQVQMNPGLTPTITALCVDTGVIPEPSSMALLCMGAAGLAAFRRRKKTPAA